MRCDTAQRLASRSLDEPLPEGRRAELDDHVRGCEDCASFLASARTLRRQLRVGAVGAVPDIATRVLERIERDESDPRPAPRPRPATAPPRRSGTRHRQPAMRRLAAAAAVFLVGFVAGAVFVGASGRAPVMARTVGERALEAQTAVQGLSIHYQVTERGRHPAVPVRTYDAFLGYDAPARLEWRFDDTTDYPTAAWVDNDGALMTAPDAVWTRGVAGCPVDAMPECLPTDPRVHLTRNPEPFSGPLPAALDLVVPVRSFTPAGPVERIGERTVAGRPAIGVAVTAAQIQPLLDTLTHAGNWRDIHPADDVQLWLDDDTLVPLAVTVSASDDPARRDWALAAGYDDTDAPILELTADAVGFHAPSRRTPPPDADAADAGFRAQPDDDVDTPTPVWLPPGMAPYEAGVVQAGGPTVHVRTWTDGRAWVKVRTTTDWPGGRLFGVPGPLVQARDAPGAGTLYAAEGGSSVALHGDGIEAVVTGSVSTAALERIAASLGITGRPVPDDWVEASTATLDEAARHLPGVLVLPGPSTFAAPSVRIEAGTVVQAYTGPGARGFVLTQTDGARLGPPLDADVRAVAVRGTAARYTPVTGRLEWREGDAVVGIESDTLALDELAAIAERLEPHTPPDAAGE